MTTLTTFDATREVLSDMLRSVRDGRTQLPDFQRGWVWDDHNIRSLLASISLSYPIGAVMMLQAGGVGVRFKTRPLEGVDATTAVHTPERLVLDGQQRLTSLYQALLSGKPVLTRDARGHDIERWYYLDIRKALEPDGDREEAIVGVPASRVATDFRGKVIKDLTTTAAECAAEMFPLPLVFDTAALMNWMQQFLQADPTRMAERLGLWGALTEQVIQRFQQYSVPVIVLRKETPKDAVCQVFEKVNTRGVSLTVFELLTATFAADDFHLRDDWATREKRLRKNPILASLENTEFLQALTLLVTYERRRKVLAAGGTTDNAPGVSCKRRDVLRLTLTDYTTWTLAVTEGFELAARLLFGQKIFAARDLPYHSQLVPLAAVLAVLGKRAETVGTRTKLLRWYWCGVFGELYGGATESRIAKDLAEVVAWIEGGAEPSTISEASFVPERLRRLRTRNSAAYKGLYALLLRDGGLDLRTGDAIEVQQYFDDAIDIHHIFPKAWCADEKIDRGRCDCIVNKTPLASKTNRMIGGSAPSVYLPKISKDAGVGISRMDELLRSHVIEPKLLRGDNFDKFFAAREQALLARIEAVMGKPLAGTSNTALGTEHEEDDTGDA